jgi:uncharacterized cofD-like protein
VSDTQVLGRLVAFGGGHGLFATLRAGRSLLADSQIAELTAIVGVSDDGGSSGRIRRAFDVAPPGDLRMAITALLPQGSVGENIESILQYRFPDGDLGSPIDEGVSGLEGHVVGNVLLTALWNAGASTHEGLDLLCSFFGVQGRVLPCSSGAIEIVASIAGLNPAQPELLQEVSGQVAIATTTGTVRQIRIQPDEPPACVEAVNAIDGADFLVFGPGSWFTSVVPPLLVPGIREAIRTSSAQRILIMNLTEQIGETSGYTTVDYLNSWRKLFPEITINMVVVDPNFVEDQHDCEQAAHRIGARVFSIDVATSGTTHDPEKLARALRQAAIELGSN